MTDPIIVTAPATVVPPQSRLLNTDGSVAANTTREEDKHSAGQRQINLVWEMTQAFVAVSITCAAIYCGIREIDSDTIKNGFFLIVGFYFGRTNHQKVGGVQLGR